MLKPVLFDDCEDTELLIQMADGDRTALGELYDRYAGSLLALAQAIVGPSVEAEEVLHELFLEAWRLAPSWQAARGRRLRVWLFARMRERCLQELREAPELGAFGQPPSLLPRPWRRPGRCRIAALDDPALGALRARVQGVLAELSATTRQCLELSMFEGLTLPQLAARTNMSEAGVMRRLATAHETLSRNLRSEWS
jgi:RNA polymerase sigma-70 factor (ECF subfamily)